VGRSKSSGKGGLWRKEILGYFGEQGVLIRGKGYNKGLIGCPGTRIF